MKSILKRLTLKIAVAATFLGLAVFGSGCVAFHMGTETFTTEYPTEIQATSAPPSKTYATTPITGESDPFHRTATFGLAGMVTIEQPQVQKYEKVSVEKQKRISFGCFPGFAEDAWRPSGSLRTMMMVQGEYSAGVYRQSEFQQFAQGLTLLFGMIPMTIYATLGEPFLGQYECDSHHWADEVGGMSFSVKEASYLAKFSSSDRNRIGAWTCADNNKHPHRPCLTAFTHVSPLFGFHKYCNYTMKGPFEAQDRQTKPKITTVERIVVGPYSATLKIPDLGFVQTVDVPAGGTIATFNLTEAANGQKSANGTIRFQPPLEGIAQIANTDDRACLEEAQEHDYPVTIALPAPRLEDLEN